MAKKPLSFSLKQKLSSLSLSASDPTSPTSPGGWASSPKTPTAKRRQGLFGWTRNEEDEEMEERVYGQEDLERVEAVLEKVICQAGVDYETRPMVVITAATLPDPRTVSYDLLLIRILAHLDVYVESDYTVVFLTAGGRYNPGWNWVWKAYRSLKRKYRKNLKKLYIVHSTWFSKMLFSLAGAIISPKFFRKIQYISTLSELAVHVPLTQIDVSPAVYQENLKYERQITLPEAQHANVFGVPLEHLMGEHGERGGIPRVVKDCVEYIRECGMEVEGIFRRSPNSMLLRQAKEAYDRGHPVSLSSFVDPHIAAVLLKKFFRDLPEPIFHEDMYPVTQRCPLYLNGNDDEATIMYIREQVLPALRSDAAEIILSYVCHLLHDVSLRSSINLMDAHNLAVCFCPTLVGSNPARDLQMCSIPGGPSPISRPASMAPSSSSRSSIGGGTTVGMVIKFCIEHYFDIFEEVVDRSEPLHSPNAAVLSQPDASLNGKSTSGSTIDEDESLDDAMLVMPMGPTPPASALSTPLPAGAAGRSPPTAWRSKHRRMGSGTSARSAVPSTPSTSDSTQFKQRGAKSLGGAAVSGSRSRASMISIEKAVTKNGVRNSIALGKGTRRPGGAGVEAVSVTALGFFMPPSEDGAAAAPASDSF